METISEDRHKSEYEVRNLLSKFLEPYGCGSPNLAKELIAFLNENKVVVCTGELLNNVTDKIILTVSVANVDTAEKAFNLHTDMKNYVKRETGMK